jgi:hypothetical protein
MKCVDLPQHSTTSVHLKNSGPCLEQGQRYEIVILQKFGYHDGLVLGGASYSLLGAKTGALRSYSS